MSVPEIFYRMRQVIKGYYEENFGYKFNLAEKVIVINSVLIDTQVRDIKTIPNNLKVFGIDFDFSNLSESDKRCINTLPAI